MILRAQTLLDSSLFCHIDRTAEVFEQVSCVIEHRMAGRMNVLDGSVGQLEPVVENIVALFTNDSVDGFKHPVAILRMEQREDLCQIRRKAALGIQSMDA